MTKLPPPTPILSEPTPQGALFRALSSHFPHSIPTPRDVNRFVAEWMLTQDLSKPYLAITDVVVITENWVMLRKDGVA